MNKEKKIVGEVKNWHPDEKVIGKYDNEIQASVRHAKTSKGAKNPQDVLKNITKKL